MTDRLPEHILTHLKDVVSKMSMESADFDAMTPGGLSIKIGNGTTHYDSITGFIRERTKLWRRSWIIDPLEEVLEWSASVNDGTMAECDLLGRLRAKLPNPGVLEEAYKEIERLRLRCGMLEDFKRKVGASHEKLTKELANV